MDTDCKHFYTLLYSGRIIWIPDIGVAETTSEQLVVTSGDFSGEPESGAVYRFQLMFSSDISHLLPMCVVLHDERLNLQLKPMY